MFGQKSNKSSGDYNHVEYQSFHVDVEGDPHSWLRLWRPACALALDLPHHSAQSQSASPQCSECLTAPGESYPAPLHILVHFLAILVIIIINIDMTIAIRTTHLD